MNNQLLFIAGLIFEAGLLQLILLGNLTEQSGAYFGLFSVLFLLF